MTITSFTRENLKTMRDEMNEALGAIASRHGLAFKLGSISFSPQSFKVRVEAIVTGQEAGVAPIPFAVEAADFKFFANVIGLEESDLGRTIILCGHAYTVAGYRKNAHKNNIVIVPVRGGRAKVAPLESVAMALKISKK